MTSRYRDFAILLSDDSTTSDSTKDDPKPILPRRSMAELLPPTQIKTRSMTKDAPLDVKLVYCERTPRRKPIAAKEVSDFKQDLHDTTQRVRTLSISNSTPLRESNHQDAPHRNTINTSNSLGKAKRIPLSDSRVSNRGLNTSAKRIPRIVKSEKVAENTAIDSNPFLEAPTTYNTVTKTRRRRSGAISETTLERKWTGLSLNDQISSQSSIAAQQPKEVHPASIKEKDTISIAKYRMKDRQAEPIGAKTDMAETPTSKGPYMPLRGVIAFVDAKTADGDDAGPPFADVLRKLGARVLKAFGESITHVIFKEGSQATLTRVRQHSGIKLVSLQWVQQCSDANARIDERPYMIDINEMPSYRKRRKSMEPKSQAATDLRQLLQAGIAAQQATQREPVVKTPPKAPSTRQFLSAKQPSKAAIELARRKSLQFAPKVSSPLAKYCWNADE